MSLASSLLYESPEILVVRSDELLPVGRLQVGAKHAVQLQGWLTERVQADKHVDAVPSGVALAR